MGWFEAADHRVRPRTRNEIVRTIEARNGYRLWRLRRDFKWLQKQYRRMGLDPEEARWLL